VSRFLSILFVLALARCFIAPSVAAESIDLVVEGQPRKALIERSGSAPAPTIIMLHGAAGGAAREVALSGLAQLGPRNGFSVVFPEGRGGRWNFFPPGQETDQDRQFFQSQGGLPDDVGFLKALVADLVRRGLADPKRVYLAGRSLGGVMALRMVCADAGSFAAIGLLISAMPEVTGANCRPSKPLPALMINATADRILPYAGGLSVRRDPLWSTERLLGFMRALDGCAAAVQRSTWPGQSPPTIEIERSADCANGPVIFYRVVGGGHEVPGSLDAGRLLLDFFRDRTSVAPDHRPGSQAGSVRALFEKYDLVGAFAHDCGKPVGGGNLYIFHRVVGGDDIQRAQMSGDAPGFQDGGRPGSGIQRE
jgi:polyhydroxybutyrate depolymerase